MLKWNRQLPALAPTNSGRWIILASWLLVLSSCESCAPNTSDKPDLFWEALYSDRAIYSVATHRGESYAGADDGVVLYQPVGGAAWQETKIDSTARVILLRINQERVYAGLNDGSIWWSTRTGVPQGWSFYDSSPSVHLTSILLPKNGDVLFADDGMLVRRESGSGSPEFVPLSGITDLEQSPTTESLFVSYSSGVARSLDGGKTWTLVSPQTSLEFFNFATALTVTQTGTVYAASGHSLYKGTEDGANWSQVDIASEIQPPRGIINDIIVNHKGSSYVVMVATPAPDIMRQQVGAFPAPWRRILHEISSTETLYDLSESPEGQVLAATSNGIYRYRY